MDESCFCISFSDCVLWHWHWFYIKISGNLRCLGKECRNFVQTGKGSCSAASCPSILLCGGDNMKWPIWWTSVSWQVSFTLNVSKWWVYIWNHSHVQSFPAWNVQMFDQHLSGEVLPPDKQLGERGSSLSGGQRQRLGTQHHRAMLVMVNVFWAVPFGPFMVFLTLNLIDGSACQECCDLTRSYVISCPACFRLAIARAIARGHFLVVGPFL